MTVTVFHESDGYITYYADSDQLTAGDITEATPVGGGYIVVSAYPDPETEYVSGGAVVARTAITVSDDLEVDADGTDAVWFEVPSGTTVSIIPKGREIAVAEQTAASAGLVVIRANLVGAFTVLIEPPFPYIDSSVSLNAVAVGTPADPTDTPPGSPTTVLSILLEVPTPTGFDVVAKPKAVRLRFNGSPWPYHSHFAVTRYASSGDAAADTNGARYAPVYGTHYRDDEELTRGASYWYRLDAVDEFGNVSAKCTAVSVTYRGANSGDLENNAATPSKVKQVDRSNMVRDPDCVETSLFTGSGGTLQSFAMATVTESSNYLYLAASTSQLYIHTNFDLAVKANKKYYASITFGSRDTGPATYSAYVNWYSMDVAGALTFITSELIGTHTSSTQQTFEKVVTAANNARRALIVVYKDAGSNGDLCYYSPIFRKAVTRDQVGDGEILDAKTDQTAPVKPSAAPTMTGVTADIDLDGTLDTGFSMNLPAPVSGVPVKFWEIEIQVASVQGSSGSMSGYSKRGTPIVVKAEASGNTYVEFKGKANKWFKTRYRGISFSGKEGTWSDYQALGQKPGGYAGYVGLSAGAPVVTPIANGYRVSWSLGALETTIYKETEILVNGVSLRKLAGTEDVDMTARTVGDTPTFTVKHYDKQGGATNVSTGTVAGAYRAVASGEIGASAVTTAAVAPMAITPSKLFPRNFVNLVSDPEMLEVGNFAISNGNGTLSRVANDSADALGPSRFMMKVTGTTSLAPEIAGPIDVPVEEQTYFRIGAVVGMRPDQITAGSSNFTPFITIDYYSVDSSGNPTVFISSETITGSTGANVSRPVEGNTFAPPGAQVARLRAGYTRASGASESLYVASLYCRTMIYNVDIVDGVYQRPPIGHIGGMTLSNNATDPTNDIDIDQGECCADSAYPGPSMLGAIFNVTTLTKRLDAAWAAGNNAGGLDTGTVANGVYHVWAIAKNDGSTCDFLFSLSATTPTLPSGYERQRRIGSIIRSGGAILAFKQRGNEFLLNTPILDVDVTQGTSANSRTLTVPTGIQVDALVRVYANNSVAYTALLSSLDVADAAPSSSAAPLATVGGPANTHTRTETRIRTNTSGQIRTRASDAGTTLRIATYGWIDERGQD